MKMKEHFKKHEEEIKSGLDEEDEIYKEIILEHYKNPKNKGEIKHNKTNKEINPTCGDEITIYISIKDNKIKDISFTGHGCAISQAAISMLTDKIKNKDVQEVKKMTSHDVYKLLGIPISPARIKCALLGLKTIQGALK